MKTVFELKVPETKEEWKESIKKNAKKIIGGAVILGVGAAGAILGIEHHKRNQTADFEDETTEALLIPETDEVEEQEENDEFDVDDEDEEESETENEEET